MHSSLPNAEWSSERYLSIASEEYHATVIRARTNSDPDVLLPARISHGFPYSYCQPVRRGPTWPASICNFHAETARFEPQPMGPLSDRHRRVGCGNFHRTATNLSDPGILRSEWNFETRSQSPERNSQLLGC